VGGTEGGIALGVCGGCILLGATNADMSTVPVGLVRCKDGLWVGDEQEWVQVQLDGLTQSLYCNATSCIDHMM
jgi:hypothetical protein